MTDPKYTVDPDFEMPFVKTPPSEPATPPRQVGGDHYIKRTIQPFDIIDEYKLDFYEGNAVKYLLRWKDKNGVEDLEKAKHYIDEIIKREVADTYKAVKGE